MVRLFEKGDLARIKPWPPSPSMSRLYACTSSTWFRPQATGDTTSMQSIVIFIPRWMLSRLCEKTAIVVRCCCSCLYYELVVRWTMPTWGRYSGIKKKLNPTNPCGHTTATNRSTHPQPYTTPVPQQVIQQWPQRSDLPAHRVSLNPTHGTTLFRKNYFVAVLVETRGCCPRVAALGTIFLASPALCPCDHCRPLGDMQAVSCGARSRQYSRLMPASNSRPRPIVKRAGPGPMGRVQKVYLFIDSCSSDAPRLPIWARHPLCAGHREELLTWRHRPRKAERS